MQAEPTVGAKIIRTIVLLIVGLSFSRAQEMSRASERVETLRRALATAGVQADNIQSKCATPLFVLASAQMKRLSPSVRAKVVAGVARTELQKNRLSPSGHFRVHYDTTGINTPALLNSANEPIANSYEAYVDSVTKFFDYAWAEIVDAMIYAHPPLDGTDGGGPEYDIYIEDLPAGYFGQTTLEAEVASEGLHKRYISYITIDNDFRNVRTRGMSGLQVVAAHEFYHAVQLGGYGVWGRASDPEDITRDFYFYELSAVWMEDLLFTNVNDYLLDLPDYFTAFRDPQNRSFSFTTFTPTYQGYERSLWAHFLAKRFGRDIVRDIWIAINSAPLLESMERVLQEKGTSLEDEYAIFSYWNYFTGTRADTVRYYPEGKHYPLYQPNATLQYSSASQTIFSHGGYPLSTQMLLFTESGEGVFSIVSNVDIAGAQSNPGNAVPFQMYLSKSDNGTPYQQLKNGLKIGFTAASPTAWRILHIESATNTVASVSPGPAPNPIRMSEISLVTVPVTTTAEEAEVFFLSSSLDLVFSGKYPVSDNLGKRYIQLPTRDFRSSVNSGIYFIVVHGPDADQKWKVAVIQ